MSHSEQIRNSIIDKLLSINNPELLAAFYKILESNKETVVGLNASQKEMLQMSESDIKSGRFFTQEEID